MLRLIKHIIWLLFLVSNHSIFAQLLNEEIVQNIQITNEQNLNTSVRDFSPAFWGDELVFVHSGSENASLDKKINEPYFDLKFAVKGLEGTFIKSAYLPKSINSSYHEGQASIDDSGLMYFTSDNTEEEQLIADEDGVTHLQIYTSQRTGNQWGKKQRWVHCQTEYSYTHPSISAGGDSLVFASNMPGGKGKMDLYISTKHQGIWSPPKPLVALNSEANDWFGHLKDGSVFFASDRDSLGGLDIFVSKVNNENLELPSKLPPPINSPKDDFGFIVADNEAEGYFSSNRSGGVGMDDIYKWQADTSIFFVPEPEVYKISFKNESDIDTRIPIRLMWTPLDHIVLSDYNSWEVFANKIQYDLENISFEKSLDTFLLNNELNLYLEENQMVFYQILDGTFNPLEGLALITQDDTVSLNISKKVKKIKPVPKKKITILDVPVEKGSVIVFNNIYYEFNSAELKPSAFRELDLLATAMLDNPQIKVQLSAHTDARGSDVANQKLSDQRAQSAKEYLVRKGILSSRIYTVGFGESRLRNHCEDGVFCSEDEHQYNRRTEVKILENK